MPLRNVPCAFSALRLGRGSDKYKSFVHAAQLLMCTCLLVFGSFMFRDSGAATAVAGIGLPFPTPAWEDAFRFHESREAPQPPTPANRMRQPLLLVAW